MFIKLAAKSVFLCFLTLFLFHVPAMAAGTEDPEVQSPDQAARPVVDRNLIKIIGEVAKFYERAGMGNEANKIRDQLKDGVFVLTPGSEIDNDQGRFSNGKILINKEVVDRTLFETSKGASTSFFSIISMAATIYHENLHAGQSTSTFVAGKTEKTLTGDNTRIEQEVWEKTVALQAQWIDALLKKRDSAQTDAEKKEAEKWLNAAIKSWNDYVGQVGDHLGRKTGELKDTQWKGPGGISGTMSKGKNGEESELWVKFRAWKAGLDKGAGSAKSSEPPVSDDEILKDICRCSTSCTAGVAYNTSPVKASPSCEDPSNGPCLCSGYGCMRYVMSPSCIVKVLQEKRGRKMNVSDVLQFIDQFKGPKPPPKDPSSIWPLFRKGEAYEMRIHVPGKETEKWLWQSSDAITFKATRITPGPGPATETVKLMAPSMGHVIFERSSTPNKILGARDLFGGGFSDGITDGYPEGTTVGAIIIKDPNPTQADAAPQPAAPQPAAPAPPAGQAANNPASPDTGTGGGAPDFSKPSRVDLKGRYSIFEPVPAPMTLKGQKFSKYFLQHPGDSGPTSVNFLLNGSVSGFSAKAGIDQSLHPETPLRQGATVRITVSGDGKILWKSNVIDRNTALQSIDVDVRGVKELIVTVDDAGDGNAFDWLVWGDPVFKSGAVSQPAPPAPPAPPAGQTANAPASPDAGTGGGAPDFSKPSRVDIKGRYSIFEPVSAPMTLKGQKFSKYFLQHPGDSGPTTVNFLLNGSVSGFSAKAGIDQSLHPETPLRQGATVKITVLGDGKILWKSNVIDRNTALQIIDVDVRGVKELTVTVDDAGDGNAFDWLVWGDPVFR